ncbi:SymE family type I addiction module toxin [Spirosoma liriopis]
MNSRTRKVQSRYKVSGTVGNRRMSVSPSLELSGNWFKAAGFAPGQLVSVETQDGVITIRAAR